MRSALQLAQRTRAGRTRSTSLSTVPPSSTSDDYIPELAAIAASILYRCPLPSREGRPLYVLNAAAFPDAFEVDYDSLLSYVLARLPGEDALLSGTEYEIVFFAGGQADGATSEKKAGPGMGWYLQAYHVLSRATRKKLQRLYIVHPRTWVRVLVGVFGTIVSPKFRRKIVHVNTLSQLAIEQPIYRLLIPPAVYLHDRKLEAEVEVPYASGRRAFGARVALPKNLTTGQARLPRVLREATTFILQPACVRQEGLFRIPPHNVLAGVLKEAYDRGQMWIVWKERGATCVQPGIDQALVDEVRLEEAYGVHLAASLIKTWYRELREPIFPESSYQLLRERYGGPDAEITPEDLVDLLLPASPTSPLSPTGREVLARHLLPLLSEITVHKRYNKMSADNIAICFSMCLVCGSDQLEDAKVSSIIRRILSAAIEMWPVLREGMGISLDALIADLQPPSDLRDYEDPADEESSIDAEETTEEHSILLEDVDEVPQRTPTLPPRPPPHRARSRATSDNKTLLGLDVSSPVKRKPVSTATSASSSPSTASVSNTDPPRYSSVFDTEGDNQSPKLVDLPPSCLAANGLGPGQSQQPLQPQTPLRAGEFAYPLDQKKKDAHGLPIFEELRAQHPVVTVPKRKVVGSEHSRAGSDESAHSFSSDGGRRSASDGARLSRIAAEKAASALAQRMDASPAFAHNSTGLANVGTESMVQSPESSTTMSLPSPLDGAHDINGELPAFRPSWPASANHQPATTATASTRPAPPARPNYTVPLISAPNTINADAYSTYPRPRTPSPGLQKRISTISAYSAANGDSDASSFLRPSRGAARLKKASVEDLRRLYEGRVEAVEGLRRVEEARRKSTPGLMQR
ncbi:hypothetical protein B0A50_05691 [Salinomyces thailandicus]|uniref:Uncharacterized protein n=1 Tax=Salinomyces thailandicus TaxID=706561 RepID=A0A4U0TRA6_9PEZI|nr:hypothetical protein B0A50_05691 [Salinomyces thailandica]